MSFLFFKGMSESLERSFDSCTAGYYDYLLIHREKWMTSLLALKEENTPEKVISDVSNTESAVNLPEKLPPENSSPTASASNNHPKQECSKGAKIKTEKNTCMKCPVETCRFFCYSQTVMTSHMHVHSSVSNFACDYQNCHRTFKTKYQLKYHRAQHDGTEMFRCPYHDCDFCCSNFKYLEVHKRVHTGDNPFTCNYPGCKAVFKQKSLLKQHEQRHYLAKPIVCRYKHCGFFCRTRQKMDIHLETVHGKHLK